MKKLGKLKLNQLSQAELNEREMCLLLGSGTPGDCNCGCGYANSGGSSSSDNSSANNAQGYTESYGYSGGSVANESYTHAAGCQWADGGPGCGEGLDWAPNSSPYCPCINN